jgi:hypothetical protein
VPDIHQASSSPGEQVDIKYGAVYLLRMTGRRVFAVAGWLALAFIIYATLCPIDDRPAVAGPQVEHFAAFALTGLAFALAYPNRIFLIITIVVGSAFMLETMQLLTPDRHGRLLDAMVKAAGGFCGIGAGQIVSLFLPHQLAAAEIKFDTAATAAESTQKR